jgi:ribosomal protein S27E
MNNQQFDMRSTLDLLNSVAQGRRILNEGRVGQISDDLESLSDAEFFKEYGKTKAEKRKEFSGDKSSAVKEGISNGDEDPNLRIAYNMGHKAYQAYRDNPEAAQQAQDKIEQEFPQYLKMWTTGYRDGERFDKQKVKEGAISSTYGVEDKACPVCKEKELTYDQGSNHISCAGCGNGFSQTLTGKWRKDKQQADEGRGEARPDVMRHKGDTTVKIVKKAGKPIGEIGIDAEASEGNGQYYVKLYDGSYDSAGYDSVEEALAELKYAVSSGMKENFGGGMRDRPGPEYKSFDLAENRKKK